MQSRDATVLKAIRRPTSLVRLDEGIRRLTRRRIKVTLDVMYGLPRQTLDDVRRSTAWALRLPHTNVQCLQTLLLPETELRDRHSEWGLTAQPLPPYAVTATSTMDARAFHAVETLIARHPKLRSDVPTPRFVGKTLDLFPDPLSAQIRQAYRFTGPELFGKRVAIGRLMADIIRREPDGLFQFVLCPDHEEPLDLLEYLIGIIRKQPSHLVDRYASVALADKVASRRLMVQLPAGKRFDKDWVTEAEDLLASAFF